MSRMLKRIHLMIFVMFFVSTSNLLAVRSVEKVNLHLGPGGVLYVLTNQELVRFDFATNKSTSIFPKLFPGVLRLNHFGYLKDAEKFIFSDSGDDFPSRKARFVAADPKTCEVKTLFDSDRTYSFRSVSYSPDSKWFSFLDQTEEVVTKAKTDRVLPALHFRYQLRIQNIPTGHIITLADDADVPDAPALWLSNQELLYVNFAKQLAQINIKTQEKNIWDIQNIVPQALSPDGAQILATDMDHSNIYLLDIATKSLRLVKKYGKRQLYGPMVWSPDGQSFIYNRMDNRDHFLPQYFLGETPWRLYWHDLATGKEKRISENSWWNVPWKDIWLYNGAIWFSEDPFKPKT